MSGTSPLRQEIVIMPPEIRDVGSEVQLHFAVDGLTERSLWFTVEREFAGFIANRLDAALVALLPAAMYLKKNIYLNGDVSEDLMFNVNRYVVPLSVAAMPGVGRVRATAANQVSASSRNVGHGVFSGLSCGIDSFATVHDYLLSDTVPNGLQITHFLFNEVGAHGNSRQQRTRELFEVRLEAIKTVAALLGRPLIRVNSNVDFFYTNPFQQTHTFRNAAVAHALAGGARHFLYSSGLSYSSIHAEPATDTAEIDPILLPLLSTTGLTCHSAGAGYSRLEKTAIVSKIATAAGHLDVCTKGYPNCGSCFKCARTIFSLELLGQLDRFSGLFSIEAYRKAEAGYLAHVRSAEYSHPFLGELRRASEQSNRVLNTKDHLRIGLARILRRVIGRWRLAGSWRLHRAYGRLTNFSASE